MTVKVTKPAINVREELADLRKPSGIAGEAMLRAETPQEQFNLIGAGRRNLIINGAMQVAQRGTSVTGITSTGYRTVDRWRLALAVLGTWTQSQADDAPEGFSSSLKMLCTTADANPGTGDYAVIQYKLEGYDLQQLKYGTSSASDLTLSFWVKSNKTGVGSLEIINVDNSRSIYLSYTVDFANTWEYKTVTISGDTISGPNNDNGTGLEIAWWLNSGSNFNSGSHTTSFAASSNLRRNASNLGVGVAVNDYFQITGVQLEVGKVATPFEHRSYGEELAACQRYTYVIGGSGVTTLGGGSMYTSTAVNIDISLPVQMRGVSPSLTAVPNGTGNWLNVYVGATGTLSNATPQVGEGVQASIRLYATNAHSGSSPSAAGAAVWCMVLAGAKLIISEEL